MRNQHKPTLFLLSVLGVLAVYAWPVVAAPAPVVATTLPNGITLLTRTDHTSPRVAISLLVRAGAANETEATAGWRRLLTDAMLRASLRSPAPSTGGASAANARTAVEMQRAAEVAGGSIGAIVSDDFIEFWGAGTSADASQLMDLVLALAWQPRLADKDIDGARQRLLARIDDEADVVALRAVAALHSQLYRDARGELAAYGLPSGGTAESLAAVTNQEIRDLHNTYFRSGRFVVSVVGDVDVKALRARLGKIATGGGPALVATGTVPYFQPPNVAQPPLVVRQMQTPSAWVFISYSVAGFSSGDEPALRVLAAVLGESSRARLPRRLLSKSLLPDMSGAVALQAVVQFTPRRFASEIVAFAQTGTQNVDAVKNAILDEVSKLRDKPVSASELETAKRYVRGAWAVEREGLRERAFQAAFAAAAGGAPDTTWPDRVATVTAADVQRVARKYLQAYAVALIMPEE